MDGRAKADFQIGSGAGLREVANTYKSGVYWDGTQEGVGGRGAPNAGRVCTWCRGSNCRGN